MPRKIQPKVEYTRYEQILRWIQFKPIYGMVLILLFVALVLIIIASFKSPPTEVVVNKETTAETITKETAIEVSQPAVTLNEITALEEKIQKQHNIIEKLQAQNTILENNMKLLDKRLQAHTDVMKRICEYIVVITVDKKIIPRQCLLEYKWQKEEGQ